MNLRARTSRGLSLIELSMVLVMLGVLAAVGMFTFGKVTQRADENNGEHAVRSVATAQALRFSNRGAFTDDASVLSQIENSWSYVGGEVDPADDTQLSVQVGRHQNLDTVAISAHTDGRCVAMFVVDPRISDARSIRFDADNGCSAATALEADGGS